MTTTKSLGTNVKVSGVKVVTLGKGGNYARIPGKGRVFFGKDLGLTDGDILNGTVHFQESTYDMMTDGVTPRAEALVRLECEAFVSFADQKNSAIDQAIIAQIPDMKFDASHFGNSFKVNAKELIG